ncbi:hypothetical protein [Burkholderia sp. 8Y]|nr:hypothetical protein [Burkholderia sp. 8Y]
MALSFELFEPPEPPEPLGAPAMEIVTFVDEDEELEAFAVPPASSA